MFPKTKKTDGGDIEGGRIIMILCCLAIVSRKRDASKEPSAMGPPYQLLGALAAKIGVPH